MVRSFRGRQRVKMVRIEKESNRQVTFSKRRAGVFKKASELCTLCGAEVAVVVFSPGKKVYSFGHPSVPTVVERFFGFIPPGRPNAQNILSVNPYRDATIRDLNMQLTMLSEELEAEQKKGEELKEMRKANQGTNWWESPINQLGMGQLDQLEFALEELKKNVGIQAQNLLSQSAGPSNYNMMGQQQIDPTLNPWFNMLNMPNMPNVPNMPN